MGLAARLPTLEEELHRKAWETLGELLQKHELGKITQAQLDTGLDALFGALAGLIEQDFMDTIAAASKEFQRKDGSYAQRILLANRAGDVVLIERETGEGTFYVKNKPAADGWGSVIKRACEDAGNPSQEAQQQMEAVARKLIAAGYGRLS